MISTTLTSFHGGRESLLTGVRESHSGISFPEEPRSNRYPPERISAPSRILRCSAQQGWRDERAEERSCSLSRSRAFLPSAGGDEDALALLAHRLFFFFAVSLSLPLRSTLPSLSIMQSRLSLSLLLLLPPPLLLPRSLSQLSHSLTPHALSTVKAARYQQRRTQTQTGCCRLLLSAPFPSFLLSYSENYKRCSHPSALTCALRHKKGMI